MLRFRILAIACGYEDADDCDALRTDPLFKLAAGRAPQSGRARCSQPTMSRLENTPTRIEVARMRAALVDLFCRSFGAPPAAITLDIDDTCDAVHGHRRRGPICCRVVGRETAQDGLALGAVTVPARSVLDRQRSAVIVSRFERAERGGTAVHQCIDEPLLLGKAIPVR